MNCDEIFCFKRAMQYLLRGSCVKRLEWKEPSRLYLDIRNGKRFITLRSNFPDKPWQPYFDDFLAEDWVLTDKGSQGRVYR